MSRSPTLERRPEIAANTARGLRKDRREPSFGMRRRERPRQRSATHPAPSATAGRDDAMADASCGRGEGSLVPRRKCRRSP